MNARILRSDAIGNIDRELIAGITIFSVFPALLTGMALDLSTGLAVSVWLPIALAVWFTIPITTALAKTLYAYDGLDDSQRKALKTYHALPKDVRKGLPGDAYKTVKRMQRHEANALTGELVTLQRFYAARQLEAERVDVQGFLEAARSEAAAVRDVQKALDTGTRL